MIIELGAGRTLLGLEDVAGGGSRVDVMCFWGMGWWRELDTLFAL